MPANAHQPSFARIAEAYGLGSRARYQQISRDHGRAILMDPDKLAAAMLARKPRTVLQLLQRPDERARIKNELSAIQKPQPTN